MASFIVRIRQTSIVDVIVEGCTEEQARADPFKYAVEERNVDLVNWEVQRVEPNT